MDERYPHMRQPALVLGFGLGVTGLTVRDDAGGIDRSVGGFPSLSAGVMLHQPVAETSGMRIQLEEHLSAIVSVPAGDEDGYSAAGIAEVMVGAVTYSFPMAVAAGLWTGGANYDADGSKGSALLLGASAAVRLLMSNANRVSLGVHGRAGAVVDKGGYADGRLVLSFGL